MDPECGIMVFQGQSLKNFSILHKLYNPYTLEGNTDDKPWPEMGSTFNSPPPQAIWFTII